MGLYLSLHIKPSSPFTRFFFSQQLVVLASSLSSDLGLRTNIATRSGIWARE